MRIITGIKLDFKNVLLLPTITKISSRSQVNLSRKFKFINVNVGDNLPSYEVEWEGVPIVAANMDTIGTLRVYDVLRRHGCLTALHKFHSRGDFKGRDYTNNSFMISAGMNELDKIRELIAETDCQWICLDVANGYMEKFGDFCKTVREQFPTKIIVAGNVCTPEGVEFLLSKGVNVVKVGVGPGSCCLTRMKTGVGMPQLSTIIECAEKAHELKGYIMADGGITCPGDMAKAFCAGADFVMVGGQFAGHDENPGEIIEENNAKFKLTYGMSSEHAMQKNYGKMEQYRTSEGRVVKVPYKGSLEKTIQDYLGGLRSTGAYLNAPNIEDFYKNAVFVQTTQQLNTSLI